MMPKKLWINASFRLLLMGLEIVTWLATFQSLRETLCNGLKQNSPFTSTCQRSRPPPPHNVHPAPSGPVSHLPPKQTHRCGLDLTSSLVAWAGAKIEAGQFGIPPHKGTPVVCLWPAGEGGLDPSLPEGPGSPPSHGSLGFLEHPEGPASLRGDTAPVDQRAAGGRYRTLCPHLHCCSARPLQSCLQRPATQARGVGVSQVQFGKQRHIKK